jgi:hypothetical protein
MRRQLVEMLQVVSADAPLQTRTEALGGLGGVLGDVAGHLLSRQLPGVAIASGDVAHVELLAPPGIATWLTINGRAGHADGRDGLP